MIANHLDLPPNYELVKLNGRTQNNGFHCGVYVVFAIEWLVNKFLMNDYSMNSNIPDSNCFDCVRKRASLTYMIQNRFCISTEVLRELMTHPYHKKVTEITDFTS